MGGSTSQGAGGFGGGGYNRTKTVLKQAQTQMQLTEEYLFWLNKRNEILGQMMEDVDFKNYVLAYKDAASPHIDVDKDYLNKALDYLDVLERTMDYEFIDEINLED